MIFYLIIYLLILLATVLAIVSKKLLNSAIMLAVLSVGVAILLFTYGAFWAAVFELSVCAGLITVLFVSAVSLVKDDEDIKENKIKYNIFPLIFFGMIILFSITVPVYFFNISNFSTFNTLKEYSVGDLIWKHRGADIIAQITLLASSVFVIKHIFKNKKENEGEKV